MIERFTEKVAATKWKHMYGDLSDAAVKKLEDSGIWGNYTAKKSRGIRKGNIKQWRKNKVSRKQGPAYQSMPKNYLGIMSNDQDVLYGPRKSNSADFDNFLNLVSKQSTIAPGIANYNNEVLKNFDKNDKILFSKNNIIPYLKAFANPKNKINQIKNDKTIKNIKKSPDDREMLHNIFLRHENDEIKAHRKHIAAKDNYVGKANMIPTWSSHIHPQVIANEGYNVAAAPKNVQKAVTTMRKNEPSYVDAGGKIHYSNEFYDMGKNRMNLVPSKRHKEKLQKIYEGALDQTPNNKRNINMAGIPTEKGIQYMFNSPSQIRYQEEYTNNVRPYTLADQMFGKIPIDRRRDVKNIFKRDFKKQK